MSKPRHLAAAFLGIAAVFSSFSFLVAEEAVSYLVKQELEKQQLETLEGVWALETYTTDGETKSAEEKGTSFRGQRWLVKGDHIFPRYDGSAIGDIQESDDRHPRHRFKINPSESPSRIDWWTPNRPEGWMRLGIYKLEEDKLTICFSVFAPGGDDVQRPIEFAAEKGSRTGLAVYKRLRRP